MTLTNQNTGRFPAAGGLRGLVLALGLALGLSGCGGGADDDAAGGEPGLSVVTTTTMLQDLTSHLVGDHGRVVGLMKPGQDPHVYDVLPRDAQAIAGADLVVANGLNLEATLDDVIANNARGRVVYVADRPEIEPLGSETYAVAPDPHCWMDVSLYMVYTRAVRDALVAVDPANEADYVARAQAYLAELEELDRWVREQFAAVPEAQRVIVTSHDAFNYFGEAYGVDVHGVIGISTEQAPRPQDVAALEALVRDRGVRALFVETSTAPTLNDLVRKIAERTGVSVGGTLYSDSLGGPGSGAETYVEMMRHNVSTVVEALR